MRRPDWEARLGAYLRACRDTPFAWGRHDCCLFAAGAVIAMTGIDLMGEFRGRYRTPRGAIRALRRHGAGTLEATMDGKLLAIEPAYAKRGDLVLANYGEGEGALCVVLGRDAAAVGAEGDREGLVTIGRAQWRRAWQVPHV